MAISEGVSQLPLHVYERGDNGGKKRATDHPAYSLLHDQANDWTPATRLIEEVTRDALLQPGGGFAFINRVGGKPIELHRFDPAYSNVDVGVAATGEPTYAVTTDGQKRQITRHRYPSYP